MSLLDELAKNYPKFTFDLSHMKEIKEHDEKITEIAKLRLNSLEVLSKQVMTRDWSQGFIQGAIEISWIQKKENDKIKLENEFIKSQHSRCYLFHREHKRGSNKKIFSMVDVSKGIERYENEIKELKKEIEELRGIPNFT